MVQIIAGEKGKGKTKILLDKANTDIKTARGTIVYLDKDNQHIYELNNKIRLINVREYCIDGADEFVGFICGILSQDNDIEKIYLDSFLKVAKLDAAEADKFVEKIDYVSQKFNVDIIVSFSQKSDELSEFIKSKLVVAL
ncbi:MAG: twitching motility protein PilT [Lachnospiraceae bacterium]|nr:twitching motility protein PilT [Lachnospiraceae bacterium]MBR6274119.1 twitching motility protein PilT [Lachnospiraceae bacterium]